MKKERVISDIAGAVWWALFWRLLSLVLLQHRSPSYLTQGDLVLRALSSLYTPGDMVRPRKPPGKL